MGWISFIDFIFEFDIYVDKLWVFLLVLVIMNYFLLEDGFKVGKDLMVKEDLLEFIKFKVKDEGVIVLIFCEGNEKIEISVWWKWLVDKKNREKIKFGKDVVVGMEFVNGFFGKL